MDAQEKLYSLLSTTTEITDVVGDRIYPLKFEKEGTFPVIVYEVIDQDFHNLLTNEELSDATTFITLNTVGNSYPEVQLVNGLIINTVKNNNFVIVSSRDYFEDSLGLYGKQTIVQFVSNI